METTRDETTTGQWALLWAARGLGLILVAFAFMLTLGYAFDPNEPHPTLMEALTLAVFPVGVCLAYVLAWRWPLVCGIVGVVCVAASVLALGEADMIPVGLIVALPGVLFIVAGALAHHGHHRPKPA
jgi:hypothetical protein